MQIIKKSARNLTERFIGSSFGQKCVVAAIALIISTSNAMAGSKGAAGFTKATQEVSSYQTPVSNLMKAIAAVIVLVGAFNVYFKMQNGDQDVKKLFSLPENLSDVARLFSGLSPVEQSTWMPMEYHTTVAPTSIPGTNARGHG